MNLFSRHICRSGNLAGLAAFALPLLLSGCGVQPVGSDASAVAASVSGLVMGGQQPVSGVTVQLYEVGTTGDGSNATKLGSSVTTTAAGNFTLPSYVCPGSNPYMYILGTGGNAGAGTNPSIALMAALGRCTTISGTTISVNEVTTAAAVMALMPYIKSPTAIGSGSGDATALANAFALAAEYANTSTGQTPGASVPNGYTVPSSEIETLADVIATCVNSSGTYSTACVSLFSAATPSLGAAPVDVTTALLDIANNPTSNVSTLYNLATATGPYQPILSSAPTNWNVVLASSSASLGISPSAIAFGQTANGYTVSSQPVSITNATGSAVTLSLAMIGPGASAFSSSLGTCPGTLSSGSSCSAFVGLSTATNGTYNAVLAITNSAATSLVRIPVSAVVSPPSQWVYYASQGGSLAYKTLSSADNSNTTGLGYDQVMDFSTAGYNAGSGALPTAPVMQTVSPSGGNDTTAIQSAINSVSSSCAALNTGTSDSLTTPCGAVLLEPGAYTINAGLTITTSGVVLRGSGSGTSTASNTVITMNTPTGLSPYANGDAPYPFMTLGTSGSSPSYTGASIAITDPYVPAGTSTLHVTSTGGFSVGEHVMVKRPATTQWITFMDMLPDNIESTGACSGGACSWITINAAEFKTDRTITAVSSSALSITLDSPMSDSIDGTYLGSGFTDGGPVVQGFTFPSRISQVGVENLRVIAPVPTTNLVPPTPSYQLVTSYGVLNGWARNLTAQDPLQAVDIAAYTKQFTVSNVALTHTVTQTNSAKFEDFYVDSNATQVLMDTVSDITDNMFFYSTSSTVQGPNVLRNGTFVGNTNVEPHQRWATGTLVENTTISGLSSSDTAGQINFWDRGDYGTGQGWAVGWGVVWNSTTAGGFTVQLPPGSQNWCIGCVGGQINTAAPGGATPTEATFDSSGTYVYPYSLYQAQLTQRLGSGAVAQ